MFKRSERSEFEVLEVKENGDCLVRCVGDNTKEIFELTLDFSRHTLLNSKRQRKYFVGDRFYGYATIKSYIIAED